MQHCQIVFGLLLVPADDSTELLQPVDCPLHQIALPVQGLVEGTGTSFVDFPRYGVANSPPSEIGPNPAAAVPFVAADPLGLDSGTAILGASHRSLGQHECYWLTLTGDSQMDFGPEPSPGNGLSSDRRPPCCPSSVLMRPHVNAVHVMDFPLNLPNGISFPLHLSQKLVSQSLLPPPVETTGHCQGRRQNMPMTSLLVHFCSAPIVDVQRKRPL